MEMTPELTTQSSLSQIDIGPISRYNSSVPFRMSPFELLRRNQIHDLAVTRNSEQERTMAIQEKPDTVKTSEEVGPDAFTAHKSGHIVLTAEERANLLHSLASPPEPLSPEMKRAIANYKRIKAMRLR